MKTHDLSTTTEVLARRSWLAIQSQEFVSLVLSRARMRNYTAGQSVFEVGDPPGGIFGIVSGGLTISLARRERETGPYLAHVARPGWWLGKGCYLLGGPRRISLSALTDSRLASLPLPDMKQIAATNPESMQRFSQIAMLNLELSLQTIADLLLPTAERRIAAAL